MKYLFVLGRQPAISLAEIISLLKRLKNGFQITLFQPEILIIDVAALLDVDFLMSQLGGTIKIGLVKDKTAIAMIKEKFGREKKGKIYFGLSAYGSNISQNKNGLQIKKILKDEGWSVRFVTSREPTLSSVVVKTNKLLSDRGIEIIIANTPDGSWLAETLAVQPFAELSERDYGRPGRDALSGMLPPKLAKIMLNLAEVGPDAAILDPFCGSGTILTEAALMGFTKIFGSDSNPQAVTDTKNNLSWIEKKYSIRQLADNIKYSNIKSCDARKLSRCFSPCSIDAIVTEPYLGPPLRGNESEQQIKNIVNELSRLYLEVFKEFKKVLKPSGKIVMVWPVFGGDGCLPLFPLISEETKKLGFKTEPLLPPDFSHLLTPRGTLIYSRPGQKVGREMVKLGNQR